jgi:hypothetical protein
MEQPVSPPETAELKTPSDLKPQSLGKRKREMEPELQSIRKRLKEEELEREKLRKTAVVRKLLEESIGEIAVRIRRVSKEYDMVDSVPRRSCASRFIKTSVATTASYPRLLTYLFLVLQEKEVYERQLYKDVNQAYQDVWELEQTMEEIWMMHDARLPKP